MRGGVIAHDANADRGIHHGVNFFADMNRFFGHDFVGAHTLHRHHTSTDLGDDRIVLVVVKPSGIAHLAAGVGIKRRVVENDFAVFAGLQFADALAAFDDDQYFAATRFG